VIDLIKEFEVFLEKENSPYTKITKFTEQLKEKFYSHNFKQGKSENEIR